MELEKLPVPELSVVLLLEVMVGLVVVLQQTPLAVTDAPPSEVTLPPLVAVVEVTDEAVVVITVGTVTVLVVSPLRQRTEYPPRLP